MDHGTMVLKEFETNFVKITVEERRDGKFIATLWNKEECLEVDRGVEEFESFGGAMSEAFDWLAEAAS